MTLSLKQREVFSLLPSWPGRIERRDLPVGHDVTQALLALERKGFIVCIDGLCGKGRFR